ncbi:CapA family protein [Salinithrix halophila]|uniref:CapA family protein n=1 Tax=Salinithrix halophila TaxID=1485204 RepID=A0ABV8JG37_9BACL
MKHGKTLLLMVLLLSLVACSQQVFDSSPDPAENSKQTANKKSDSPSHLRLAVVGDLMMHDTQIQAGKQVDGSYNYDSFFKEVKPWFKQADLVVGNLETTLPGESKPYSGYPLFRAPDAYGQALREAGFDLVSTANNHSMDAGEEGVVRTYRKLKKLGIEPVGTSPGPEPQEPVLVKRNGINLSFSAYTYGTNGIPLPKGKEYLVNHIQTEKIKEDIRKSKAKGADYIAVMLHFGLEYQREPNAEQKRVVKEVLESGADVVLGGHPHVLQPMEYPKQNGREKFVIYSLGNFVSDQVKPYTNDGVILYLDLLKKHKEKTQLKKVSYIPTYVHKFREGGTRQFTVIPINKGSEGVKTPSYPSLAERDLKRAWKDTTTLMNRYDEFPVFSQQEDKHKR